MAESLTNEAGRNFDFVEWRPEGLLGDHILDVGAIAYGVDGRLCIQVRDAADERCVGELIFEVPLAVRIVGEGSLVSYWQAGLVVRKHCIFIATYSPFLEWLKRSSSGVHSGERLRHYAIFSDDVCVEILSNEAPLYCRVGSD